MKSIIHPTKISSSGDIRLPNAAIEIEIEIHWILCDSLVPGPSNARMQPPPLKMRYITLLQSASRSYIVTSD
jgi:hypothetical protein